MPTKLSSVQQVTMVTKRETEPTSTTTMSEVWTSNVAKLTTTEIFLSPSITTTEATVATEVTTPLPTELPSIQPITRTITSIATTEAMAVATGVTTPLLTRSVISSSQTTEMKDALITTAAVSSFPTASTNKTSTQKKLSAADQVVMWWLADLCEKVTRQ